MEVRQRRKSVAQPQGVAAEHQYSVKNNYGFGKGMEYTFESPPPKIRKQSVSIDPVGGSAATATGTENYMDESEIQYPDNLGSFADGLKGDIFELFETGAKVLNKSFKLLLPFGNEGAGAGSDVMRDIEIRSPLSNVTNKTKYRSSAKSTISTSKSPFKTAEDAIRMRCSSMWRKEQPLNSASEPFLPMPKKELYPVQPAAGAGIRVKEGVKVQLNKLNNGNGSIQSFDCCDDTLLLVGNRRIILALKNHDEGNTGTVQWSQPLHDIDSCTITFSSNPTVTSPSKVRLELSTQGGKLVRRVSMPNTLVCSKALQVIQERKVRSSKPATEETTSAKVSQVSLPNQPNSPVGGGKGAAEGLENTVSSESVGPALVGAGPIGVGSQKLLSSDSNDSEDLAASISAVIAATSSHMKTAGGAQPSASGHGGVAATPAVSSSGANGKTISSSKKSPELVAADALIADITAILKNLESKNGKPGSESGDSAGSEYDAFINGEDGPSSEADAYASPMKRVCYDHNDQDFSGAVISKGEVSPPMGILLNFTPKGQGVAPRFSHGTSSPMSPHGGKMSSGRKKHSKSRRHHGHDHHGSPSLSGVLCTHVGCQSTHVTTVAHSMPRQSGSGTTCMVCIQGRHHAPGISSCNHRESNDHMMGGAMTGVPIVTAALNTTDIAKFREMLSIGVPLGAVQQKMQKEGVDPEMLNYKQLEEAEKAANVVDVSAYTVDISKFRKMLSMGVPLGAVQQKMQKEGISPDMLNNAPGAEEQPMASNKPEEKGAAAIASEKKDISKFQKMLKAGVPLEAVKHKMMAEGFDPQLLENGNQTDVIHEKPTENPEQDKTLEKFKKMLKAGVPKEAVKHKMKAEGLDPDLLDGPKPKAEAALVEEAKLGPEQEKALEKFKKMLKAGVPKEAVKHKMKAEGLDPDLLDGPKPKVAPTFDTAKLKKFQMMLKAGVEVAAVLSKMTQEGFSKEEQEFVTGKSSAAAVSLPPPQAPPKNKLIALHWDPMSNTDLKDSIWGKLQGSDKIKGLGEEEMERLASMFGKKEKKEKTSEEKKPDEKPGGPPKLTVIDTTRGMNISIGLTSFKSQGITIDQMGSALEILDTKFLGIDCLLRIKEILPNDTEQKSLQGFNVERGHPAEICLFKLAQVPRVRMKVDSMIFMSTMNATGSHLTQSLATLREVAGRILISEGLKEIMVSVLAIGNAMNQGNWKGSAMGFKLGSLIKLAQTKSTDGKNTLIDYLILVLHERAKGGSAVCEAALNIDEELELVKKSKHLSMSEITKDCAGLRRDASSTEKEADRVAEILKEKLQTENGEEEKEKINANLSALAEFSEASTVLVSSVSQSLTETDGKFKELAVFFGEDSANVGSILTTLSEFIDHFAAAKHAYNRKNRKRPLKAK